MTNARKLGDDSEMIFDMELEAEPEQPNQPPFNIPKLEDEKKITSAAKSENTKESGTFAEIGSNYQINLHTQNLLREIKNLQSYGEGLKDQEKSKKIHLFTEKLKVEVENFKQLELVNQKLILSQSQEVAIGKIPESEKKSQGLLTPFYSKGGTKQELRQSLLNDTFGKSKAQSVQKPGYKSYS